MNKCEFSRGANIVLRLFLKQEQLKQFLTMTNEYYHDQEAATAHLQSVGLTFGGFLDWMYDKWRPVDVDREEGIVYSSSFLRQYIREHNTL